MPITSLFSFAVVHALALAQLQLPPEATMRGASGKLYVTIAVSGGEIASPVALPARSRCRWAPLDGGAATGACEARQGGALTVPDRPGFWSLELVEGAGAQRLEGLTVITTVPLSQKRHGWLNGYHIGNYAAEGEARTDAYAAPAGFIEVSAERQDLRVSEHFRLRDFFTHDQQEVWPKYLVLDLRLVDKLECLVQELHVSGLRVMSGYRSPQYNGPGGNGRVKNSRHTYGDAADVFVDENNDGRMDDLNGDGRVDAGDAAVVEEAVERVERRHPSLLGGAGVYRATRQHGPFVHVDARGRVARWAKRD